MNNDLSIVDAAATPDRYAAAAHSLIARRDSSKRTRFGVGSRFGSDHLTADALLTGWLRQRFLKLNQPGFLLLSLLFDGVVDDDCLERAWRALNTVYVCSEGACLDWLDKDGRQQRRLLGPVTLLARAACAERGTFHSASRQLLAALPSERFATMSRDALLSVVRARLATAVAGDVLSHLIGDHPLTAVSRSCLARLGTKLALDDPDGATRCTSEVNDNVRRAVLDAALTPTGSGLREYGMAVVNEIVAACQADERETNPVHDRRRISRELEALAPRCQTVGGWVCIFWSWAADLVDRGTNRTQPLSPNTIGPYVSLALPRLHRRLRDLPLEGAVGHDWQNLYEAIQQDNTIFPTQRGKTAAALTAWHEFLVEQLEVPALERAIDEEGAVLLPRANVIWPHEAAWVREQLSARVHHGRFDAQLAAIAALVSSAALRSQDIWHIHWFGVKVGANGIRLNIDPLPSAGTGKSLNARHPVEIAIEPASHPLVDWIERRRAEGALWADLLFGDPDQPNTPYRRHSTEGQLNAWLKAATGDASVSLHTLRHTRLSLARAIASGDDQRWVDDASAQAGHGSTQMSFDHYAHRYERGLRNALDAWVESRVLTEANVCSLVGRKPGWLRQRWSRDRAPGRLAHSWKAIGEAAAMISMPLAADGFQMAPPQPLPIDTSPDLSPARVLQWLCELCAGTAPEVIRLRHDISAQDWDAFQATLRSWSRLQGRRRRPGSAAPGPRIGLPFATGLDHLAQPKLAAILRKLRATVQRAEIASAVQSWVDQLRGSHLDLEDPHALTPMLRWLKLAGVDSRQILICHDVRRLDEATEAAETIAAVFDSAPAMRPLQPRAGRPGVYLLLRGADDQPDSDSHGGSSIQGVNALFFTVWVWLQLTDRRLGNE